MFFSNSRLAAVHNIVADSDVADGSENKLLCCWKSITIFFNRLLAVRYLHTVGGKTKKNLSKNSHQNKSLFSFFSRRCSVDTFRCFARSTQRLPISPAKPSLCDECKGEKRKKEFRVVIVMKIMFGFSCYVRLHKYLYQLFL